MDSKEEWQKYQEALRRGDPKAAAEAFRRYQAAKLAAGVKKSKPNLVSLGFGKKYPTAIPLDKIPDEIERNPEFFEHLREISAKEIAHVTLTPP